MNIILTQKVKQSVSLIISTMFLILFTANVTAGVKIKLNNKNLPRTDETLSTVPMGTAEFPGLCKYRGHEGKYQCLKVKAKDKGAYACRGKNLYKSGKSCYTCPAGYKRTSLLKKMTDPKACTKHQRGKNPKAAATRVGPYKTKCAAGQFKHKGHCKVCPAKTKRQHVLGIDNGLCKVKKPYRCLAGMALHKSQPNNIWGSLKNWAGVDYKNYCGQPFSMNTFAAEIAANEATIPLVEALVSLSIKLATNDQSTKDKVANLRAAINAKNLKQAYEIITSFDEFELVEEAANAAGQLAITVGVVGDVSAGIGFNSEAGIAIDIGQKKLLFYRAHGLTKGISVGAEGGFNLGIWGGEFVTSYSQGYTTAALDVGVGVWADYYTPKRSDGLNQPHLLGVTVDAGAGASVELGEYNEVWTKVGEFLDCDIESGFRLNCN